MIIHWSEYAHGGRGLPRRFALQGETGGGHCFHICAKPDDSTVELWAEAAETLNYIGDFPSETAAKIYAEQLAATH